MPKWYENLPREIRADLLRVPQPPKGAWIVREYESLRDRYDAFAKKIYYEDPVSQAPVNPIMSEMPAAWFAGELGRTLARKHDLRNQLCDYIRVFPDAPGAWGIILNLEYTYRCACKLEQSMCKMIKHLDPSYTFPADVTNYPDLNDKSPEFDAWFETRKTEPKLEERKVVKRSSDSPSSPAEQSKPKKLLLKKKKKLLLKRK